MNDIFGDALIDFWNNKYTEDIITTSNISQEDEMPLPHLFRTKKDMPALEQTALELCFGKVLDIGCGAGSHSLELQNNNINVTAIDISKGACKVAKNRGVKNVTHTNIMEYKYGKYDTLLLLMNGIGIAQSIKKLPLFLSHIKTLLSDDGQILLDSSDIKYMFEQEDGSMWVDLNREYYGDVSFKMHYKNKTSEPFDWLYIDFNSLKNIAKNIGLKCVLVKKGNHFDYLAKLYI